MVGWGLSDDASVLVDLEGDSRLSLGESEMQLRGLVHDRGDTAEHVAQQAAARAMVRFASVVREVHKNPGEFACPFCGELGRIGAELDSGAGLCPNGLDHFRVAIASDELVVTLDDRGREGSGGELAGEGGREGEVAVREHEHRATCRVITKQLHTHKQLR